ncbi:MAG: HyaD/HybD family hydrogenase maturation endopeptidase [Syntrophobacteraceae bacterium]|jgi:hydrogenase maturation protease
MSEGRSGRIVVMGTGNELLKDEGVGVHTVRELARHTFDFPVEIIDAGTVPDCWQGDEPVGKLVVIDAVRGGGEPGTIYRFSPEDVEFETVPMSSVHQLSFINSLKLSEISRCKPEKTVIIGVEPKEVAWGMELSEELRGRIPDIVRMVLEEIMPDRRAGGMRD